MGSDLKATIPAAVADRIATTVSAFQTGRIDLGGGMTMALPPEVGFNVKLMAGFTRITPTETVRIEGGLVDVFLEHLDAFPKGSRSVFRAQFKRFGFEGQREFGVAPSAPMAGALGLASIPGPEADTTTLAPLLTLLVEPDALRRDAELLWDNDLSAALGRSAASCLKLAAVTAAGANGYYGEDAEKFQDAAANATNYLLARVSAKDRHRYRKRQQKRELMRECMAKAGVPAATVTDWFKWALSFGQYVAPFPWNIVIAGIAFAVNAFLSGGAA